MDEAVEILAYQYAGLHQSALAVKGLLAEHHALLIATPEYNRGYTALLRNALDWASRPSENYPTGLALFSVQARTDEP